MHQILAIADDTELNRKIRAALADESVELHVETSLSHGVEFFEADRRVDLVLLATTAFSPRKGHRLDLLREAISLNSPWTRIVVLTTRQHLDLAMAALQQGAYQYVTLPIDDEELRILVQTTLEQSPPPGSAEAAPPSASGKPQRFGSMIGRSPAMLELYRQVRLAAATDIPVLLLGETGTGKDLVAQAIHQQSQRHDAPFIPVHLGALPTELVASELFGAERGAFTGATSPRAGKFEEAHNGTVFLDEIGTIDDKVQVTLLRIIEHKEFSRLGSHKSRQADVRLIAATNVDLAEAAQNGHFREDLFYRLNVFQINLPPLRTRRGDISLLVDAFLNQCNRLFKRDVRGFSPECYALLEAYKWPGNVRELKNVIQRSVLLAEGDVLLPDHLPERFREERPADVPISFTVGSSLEEVERAMIVHTLEATNNNRTRAAELLGISRRSLYSKLKKHRID